MGRSNRKSKNNSKNNGNRSSNRKGNSMAIVHVAMKSSSSAPPSAAHADYISRDGQYAERGGVELVESGNMPDFAQAEPHAFWVAADTHERANGRTYTELQIALPRELSKEQRVDLARAATREFMGDRFAYTLAVHNPEADDKEEQPHMHLMFSERVIDKTTRVMPEDQFFKRNGAKKDRNTWHDRDKPEEVRAKWCEMMNRAMESAGVDQRVDPRSLLDQGKVAEALLVEPKMLRGNGPKAQARREEIAEIREAKVVLAKLEVAAPTLEAVEQAKTASQNKLEAMIGHIEGWEAQELSKLDRAIEALKKAARAVVAGVRSVITRQPAAATPAPAPVDLQLQAAVDWFVKHGKGNPVESVQYQQQPWVAEFHGQQFAADMKTEAEKAGWIKHGKTVADHLTAKRIGRLREKYPNETEDRLLIAAKGRTLKNPLGKSQEQRSKGWSR